MVFYRCRILELSMRHADESGVHIPERPALVPGRASDDNLPLRFTEVALLTWEQTTRPKHPHTYRDKRCHCYWSVADWKGLVAFNKSAQVCFSSPR